MPKTITEFIIIFLELISFYVLPIFIIEDKERQLILIIIVITLLLSILFGFISNNRLKYFYPIFISVLFIPSIFIYYKSTSYIYVFWQLLEAFLGLFIGIGLKFLLTKEEKEII